MGSPDDDKVTTTMDNRSVSYCLFFSPLSLLRKRDDQQAPRMGRNWTTIAAKRWKGRLVSGGGAAFRHPRMWFYQFPLWNCCGRLTPFAFNYSHHFNRSLNLGHATSLSSSRQSICLVATWLRPTRRVIQPIRLVNFIRQKIQKKRSASRKNAVLLGAANPMWLIIIIIHGQNQWMESHDVLAPLRQKRATSADGAEKWPARAARDWTEFTANSLVQDK